MKFDSLRFQRLFKEGFWIVFGQAMVMIGSLVGVKLLTGLLNPAEYGELALGMTIATLINQIILGPMGQGVMRFYAPAIEEDDLCGYLYAVKRLVFISAAIIMFVILIAIVGLNLAGRSEWITISITSILFASISGYNAILSGIQSAARQRSVAAIHQGLESWSRFLVAVGLISWLGATSTVAMIGYALSAIFVVVSQSIYFLKIVPNPMAWIDCQKGWDRKILQYSWPMSIFGIFTWFQLVSDRWTLGLFRTTEEVGMYATLFQLGYYPISMATGMVVQFLAPIFFQRAGDGSHARRNANVNILSWRLTGLSLGLTGIAFGITFLLHTQIFQIFVAQQYREVSYLLPWVVLSGGIFAASQTIALNLMSQAKTYTMMPTKIGTALLGVLLNLVGSYFYGTVGIVMASVMFSISCFFSMAALSKYQK